MQKSALTGADLRLWRKSGRTSATPAGDLIVTSIANAAGIARAAPAAAATACAFAAAPGLAAAAA